MISMTTQNAVAIVENMVKDKREAETSLVNRITSVTAEQHKDPDELTAAYLRRLKTRLVHTRLEIEALEIVLAK